MDLEQTHVNRVANPHIFAPITEKGNQLDPSFYPENRPVFKLKTIQIPEHELHIYGKNQFPPELTYVKNGVRYYQFPVHPKSEQLYKPLLDRYPSTQTYLATPLSSHRSLVIWKPGHESKPLLVKVSLDEVIGNVRRNLEEEWVKRAVGVDSVWQSIPKGELNQQGIRYFEESSGIVPKEVNAGYQIRGFSTQNLPAENHLLPMFSLYANRTRGPPLIVQMIKDSGMPPLDFVKSKIMDPLIKQSVYLATREGIIGEPHSQNVLIETNSRYQPSGRFWYRDFGGFSVDENLRQNVGKSLSVLPAQIKAGDIAFKSRMDFVSYLDTYLRHGNFYALTESLKETYPEVTHEWIKHNFEESLIRELSKQLNQPIRSLQEARFAIDSLRKVATLRDCLIHAMKNAWTKLIPISP